MVTPPPSKEQRHPVSLERLALDVLDEGVPNLSVLSHKNQRVK